MNQDNNRNFIMDILCFIFFIFASKLNPELNVAYTESQAFFGGLIRGGKGGLIHGTTFVSGVFHIRYLNLKKEGLRQKNNAPAAKCHFTT